MKDLFYVDLVKLSADGKTSVIEIIKVGKIYGRGITITEKDIDDYIANFEKKVYRTDLQVNLGHNREGEAAGWIKKLFKNDGILFAEVEWTPLGIDKITSKQFRYTSSELSQSYIDPTTGSETKNVLIGVALTNIPQVKGMNPISLSEDSPYSDNCISFLNSQNMKKAKDMYNSLMKKEEITAEEKKACMAAAKEEGMPEDEMAELKKGLDGKKVKKMSEEKEVEEDKEEKTEKSDKKLSEKENNVSLSEFNKVKKLAEEQVKKNIELQERLDRADLKEVIQETLILSEDNKIGFVNDEDGKILNFMMGLSQEQREQFKEIVALVRTVDLSEIGSTKVEKVSEGKAKADKAFDEATARAKDLSEKTKRPLADCLAEEYAKLDEARM